MVWCCLVCAGFGFLRAGYVVLLFWCGFVLAAGGFVGWGWCTLLLVVSCLADWFTALGVIAYLCGCYCACWV